MRIIKNRSLPLVVVVRDEVVSLVGKGGSVVAMDELVDIMVVEGDSVGAIPE